VPCHFARLLASSMHRRYQRSIFLLSPSSLPEEPGQYPIFPYPIQLSLRFPQSQLRRADYPFPPTFLSLSLPVLGLRALQGSFPLMCTDRGSSLPSGSPSPYCCIIPFVAPLARRCSGPQLYKTPTPPLWPLRPFLCNPSASN